jgi:hypothetical protein
VVDDQRIERSEAPDGRVHQSCGVRGTGEVRLHGMAVFGAAFLDQTLRFRLCQHVIENDPGPCANEQTHGRRANAARASRD